MPKLDSKPLEKPELMSPAGHWPQLSAAIQAGADAVYFGLQHFSARAKVGFTLEELPDVIDELHRNGVKGFVTFNTLVFDHELKLAAETIIEIAKSGADAIIVQDIGIAEISRRLVPGLEVHGSTQMSISSAEGAELAASLGCSRVVLGRELDLKDIRRIAAATDVELEVFVHGALCVSYSGQCFSSEAWGGRSANRGQCAQACRLSYDLIVDGQARELGAARYLLSPGDLYALEQVPELIGIGISCLKIEGRYKDADYVALTTTAYRQAIDRVFELNASIGKPTVSKNNLEQIYSRGLGPHFMSGTNHQSVVQGRVPRHRGLRVGKVRNIKSTHVVVEFEHEILAGDGLVFDSSEWRSPDQPEEGGNVFSVNPINENQVALTFGRGAVDLQRIRAGDSVWRTNDPKLRKTCKALLKRSARQTCGLNFKVVAKVGLPLFIVAQAENGEHVEFCGAVLSAADSKALNDQVLQNQLGRLGNTPYHLQSVELEMDVPVFCPVSLLNRARREIVSQLLKLRETGIDCETEIVAETIFANDGTRLDSKIKPNSTNSELPKLHLLVRNHEQMEAAVECKPSSITLDYLELYGLRPSVERLRDADITTRVASPRILKPSEQKVIRFLLSLDCQILVRSGGLLHDLVTHYRPAADTFPELHGDFSLNAANTFSFQKYLDMGLDRIAPTHDLNAKQIETLAENLPSKNLEVVAFHHLPVFHTEHCVFCRFLSNGTDNTNCGHPCEKHSIAIRDSNGRQHPVLADVGCRNTVFGAEAQTAVKYLDRWLDNGICHIRLEFVHQSPEDVREIVLAFQQFLNRKLDSAKLDQRLNKLTPSGTTPGSLYVPRDFEKLVQLK